jgi:polyisoprenoid-binding protein YceI
MLKSLLFLSILFLDRPTIQQQSYIPSDSGSSVKFKIKNLGVTITGSFTGLAGQIHFDPANLASSNFEATIEVSTINTGIDMRDEHLRKEEYFDAKNYPSIKFVSTKVTSSNRSGTFYVFGNLTIKNITKEISFPFKATPRDGGYLFSGEFKINRRDFKVGGSSITMGDNLTVLLSVFGQKG